MAEVKRMADALAAGATMLAEACPVCNAPLFRYPSGEVRCVKCNRVVQFAQEVKKRAEVKADVVLTQVEEAVLKLASDAAKQVSEGAEAKEAERLMTLIERSLSVLERLRGLKGA